MADEDNNEFQGEGVYYTDEGERVCYTDEGEGVYYTDEGERVEDCYAASAAMRRKERRHKVSENENTIAPGAIHVGGVAEQNHVLSTTESNDGGGEGGTQSLAGRVATAARREHENSSILAEAYLVEPTVFAEAYPVQSGYSGALVDHSSDDGGGGGGGGQGGALVDYSGDDGGGGGQGRGEHTVRDMAFTRSGMATNKKGMIAAASSNARCRCWIVITLVVVLIIATIGTIAYFGQSTGPTREEAAVTPPSKNSNTTGISDRGSDTSSNSVATEMPSPAPDFRLSPTSGPPIQGQNQTPRPTLRPTASIPSALLPSEPTRNPTCIGSV